MVIYNDLKINENEKKRNILYFICHISIHT
jgi:hypothetical protein